MSEQTRISVPDFETVWATVQESAGDLSQRTAWMGRWGGKSLLLMIPIIIALLLFVVALGSMFIGDGLVGMIAFVLAIVLAAPSVIYGIRHFEAASEEHAQEVVAPMVEQLVQQLRVSSVTGSEAGLSAKYTPEGSMPVSVLSNAGFIRDARAPQEDFIIGTLGQTQFMLSDVKWQSSKVELSEEAQQRLERQARRTRERKLREQYGRDWKLHQSDPLQNSSLLSLVPASVRKTVKEKYAQFESSVERMGPSMIVFAADFHKEFTSRTYLLPRRPVDLAIRNFTEESAAKTGLAPMTLEDPGITERFVGWTTDQTEARYLITPQLMLAISDAAARMNSEHIAVSFRGSWMYFAVVLDEDRFSFQVDKKNDGGYAVAKAIYEDLVAFLSLVEDFNLNTRIWSKA